VARNECDGTCSGGEHPMVFVILGPQYRSSVYCGKYAVVRVSEARNAGCPKWSARSRRLWTEMAVSGAGVAETEKRMYWGHAQLNSLTWIDIVARLMSPKTAGILKTASS